MYCVHLVHAPTTLYMHVASCSLGELRITPSASARIQHLAPNDVFATKPCTPCAPVSPGYPSSDVLMDSTCYRPLPRGLALRMNPNNVFAVSSCAPDPSSGPVSALRAMCSMIHPVPRAVLVAYASDVLHSCQSCIPFASRFGHPRPVRLEAD